jgi:signal transduction histidine kinase
MSEQVPFRAHARLLTMLGEQLIKNERIALVELVKNSYDADASIVEVNFENFGQNFEVTPGSAIVITDNGTGMSESVVRTAWMNPATPSKAIRKTDKPRTPRGRFLQGEKGIGRFATFKLGNQVSVVTRETNAPSETTLVVDISNMDEGGGGKSQELDYYLDDVYAELDSSVPSVFLGTTTSFDSGTQIEVRGLRASWTTAMVESAFADLDRMQPQLWDLEQKASRRAEFRVHFKKDNVDLRLGESRTGEFQATLERAVLRVHDGRFEHSAGRIEFKLNGDLTTIDIDGGEMRGIRPFRERFRAGDDWLAPESGSFDFEFFIFDFGRGASPKNQLDEEQKGLLREHRIYLYRDDIRVYPYGDSDDDWLAVDATRGTQSARSMFSNDQMVGFVRISQSENPFLRDKTNREGLLEDGRATGDFVALIQSILSYLRTKPYQRYVNANRRAKEQGLRALRFDRHIKSLREEFDLPKRAVGHLDALEQAVSAERELSSMQLARTEQLAGVGLSVETASHDLIAAGFESLRAARQIVSELKLMQLQSEPVFRMAENLVLRLEFVNARFKDVQGLFVSTRQKSKKQDIVQLVKRVRSMYAGLHEAEHISFTIENDASLFATTTEAAVLQCVINLVDNATYWLMASSSKDRLIRVSTTGGDTLVVEDNGPGVSEQDREFIFEPFYSGKGEAGKGLGLYIARQNGQRSGFEVALQPDSIHGNMPGAVFTVKFGEREER